MQIADRRLQKAMGDSARARLPILTLGSFGVLREKEREERICKLFSHNLL